MPIPLLPLLGGMAAGAVIGAVVHRGYRGQPKSVPFLAPGVKLRAVLKGDDAPSYTGSILSVTDKEMVLGVAGGVLRLAHADIDRFDVLA